jgi:hypothetical protein
MRVFEAMCQRLSRPETASYIEMGESPLKRHSLSASLAFDPDRA